MLHRSVIAIAISVLAGGVRAGDPCATDLSKPLDAYLCSEKKLALAREKMKSVLSATIQALPKQRGAPAGFLVTRRQLVAAQAAWVKHVGLHCTLVADLPGAAGDWHFPVANGNICRLTEVEARTRQLEKWLVCARQGGDQCLP